MKKKYLMNGLAALAFGLVAASCSKDVEYSAKDYVSNAEKALGVTIDSNHDWKMTTETTVNVTVNLDYGAEYTVYIMTSEPLFSDDANYIGKATLTSGQTVAVTVARPVAAALLYAACYDKDNHAICKSFPVTNSGASVSFGEATATTRGANRAVSTGNRWSVTPQNMPDLSTYTTGTLYEMEEAFNTNGSTEVNQADGSEKHLKITGAYSGSIARIQSYGNQSVYVTGTWTVPEDQRCTGGSAIVVGPTGKIIIPEGHMLSTNANNNEGTTGMIYVMPGGIIEGEGSLQFSNGTQTYSYNAGTITVKSININGGTLYNAGNIGIADGTKPALTGPGGTPEQPSKFINLGHAYFTSVDGAGMAIENACNMYVTNLLALGNSSKMDNGSYIECGALQLNGSNNGGIVLYMGEAAYMNCLGDLSVNNFGVWGPLTNSARAIFKINGCNYCNYTKRNQDATYFMVDNVELIIPSPFFDDGVKNFSTGGVAGQLNSWHADYYKALLFYGWFNGYGCEGINSDNYQWVDGYSYKVSDGYWDAVNQVYVQEVWVNVPGGHVLKDNASFCYVDESRATCIYGTSPSYSVSVDNTDNCGVNIDKGTNRAPSPTIYTFAFEDTFMGDYDMNDVVLQAWEDPDNNTIAHVKLMATGAGKDLYVGYNYYLIFNGNEVHDLLGGTRGKFINTGSGNEKFQTGTPVETTINKRADTSIADLDLWIQAGNNEIHVGSYNPTWQLGSAPFGIAVVGKWEWPTEWTCIKDAYLNFATFAADKTQATDWYTASPVAGTTYYTE